MKKITRWLSLLLTFVLLLSGAAYAEAAADTASEAVSTEDVSSEAVSAEAEDKLICTLGGREVYFSDVQGYAYQLYSAGYAASYEDYAGALDYILMFVELPKLKVAQIGAENLLGEKYEATVKEAEEMFEMELDSFVQSTLEEELSEEALAEARKTALETLAGMGFTKEDYVADYVSTQAFVVLVDDIDVEVTEDDIKAMFTEYVEYDKQLFENNIEAYEYYTKYYGYASYFMPEGYRGITHILLDADAELLKAYEEAADDEAKAEAAKAIVASRQETIDEIHEKLANGTPFSDLIGEYNTDPGMAGENLELGYSVHKDSVTYVPEFTAGAFAEEMKAVGDVSEPVVTNYGIHILYYLRDVAGGAVELTDAVREEMRMNFVYDAQDKQIREWLTEYELVYEEGYEEYIGK